MRIRVRMCIEVENETTVLCKLAEENVQHDDVEFL